MTRELSKRYLTLRRNHPAWLLLASRTGPLVLAGLKTLLATHPGGVEFEVAVEQLGGTLAEHADDAELEVGDDPALTARRELRGWIKRGLIVERDGRVLPTDAL